VLVKKDVEVAVPKYEVPETVSAVEDAYGSVLAVIAEDVIGPTERVPIVAALVKKLEDDAVIAKSEVVVAAPALRRVEEAVVAKKVVEVAAPKVRLPVKVLLSESNVVEAPRAARVDS
jgi:hypothetical protein